MELQKMPNSQNNAEKEKKIWRHHKSRFQAIFQCCSDQDSMVLAQKKTHRSENRTENPEMDLQLNGQLIIFNKAEGRPNGKKTISSTTDIWKTGQQHAEK